MSWNKVDDFASSTAIQVDVAPDSVNQKALRSDDSLFTYDDDNLTPVGGRGLIAALIGDVTGDLTGDLTGRVFSTLVSKDADYTITDSDGDYIEVDPGAADKTITLPTAADNNGRTLTVRHVGTGAGGVILDGEGAEQVNGAATFTLPDGKSVVQIRCNGTSWTWVGGHIYGSTDNGDYIVFSSGVQVCWYRVSAECTTAKNYNIGTYGWSYYSLASPGTWTFPKAFSVADDVVVSGSCSGGPVATGNPTTTTVEYSPQIISSSTVSVQLFAIGLAS